VRFEPASVRSKDGTIIGYRRAGSGPAVVLVHGGMMSSYNFLRLGNALSGAFTVAIPDRRGRGRSGPFGAEYGLEREKEDLAAILAETGAVRVFALSSGAVIALYAALTLPIEKLALYEPPLLDPARSHLGWAARYRADLERGDLAAAFVSVVQGIGDPAWTLRIPRAIMVPLVRLAIRADAAKARKEGSGRVTLAELVPTMRYDVELVRDSEKALARLDGLQAETLLLAGAKSPPYLLDTLEALGRALPGSRRITFDGVGHIAADNNGQPARVAETLRAFFA
jgi:pimeloyl-ACP methyl ester carboxylesterase